MVSDYRCFFCFTRAFGRLIEEENLSRKDKNSFVRDMAFLYMRTDGNFSAPALSAELHEVLRKYSQNPDPYKQVKMESNLLALDMYCDLKNKVLNSDEPFNTAMRLAIAGNIVDYAATNGNFDLKSTIESVLNSDFAINHTQALKESILKANSILYLGDNAGEIVFDKLFIENIMHPHLTFAVRGAPVINDITFEDSDFIGMSEVADVISNGSNAPSTILNRCSAEFQDMFYNADVIISKGQGNLEGLLGKTNKNIFYLLMVKCDVIADALKVKKGDFVVYNEHCS